MIARRAASGNDALAVSVWVRLLKAHGLVLRQVRRRQQLAAVLLRRADVDEAELGIADHLLIDELAKRTYREWALPPCSRSSA